MKSVNRAVLTSMFDKVCKEKYIAVVLSIFALVITSVNFWTTNKGIFIRDEGWLNLLVNNCPNDNVSTQFYFYLKNCFDGDLLLNRLVCLSVHILSAAFFAWAIFYYYKCRLNLTKWSFLTITSLSIMGISIANIIACFVFGYILMDVQIAMISTALLLISLQVNSSRLSDFLVLICGIVCGNLAFVMITNMMMPISIFVFLLFVKDKRYQSLLFVFGILLSVVLFFTMFYPYNLSDYLDGLKSNIDATINNKFVSQHGMKAMIVWMINALVFLCQRLFP